MVYLGSTFSLQMIPREGVCINVEWITPQETKDILANGYMSLVGHQSTADVLSDMLGMSITMNRVWQGLTYDDILVVGQLVSGRLPEGCTVLPEDAEFAFAKVTLRHG